MTARRLDILVTGFGPFPHVRINPTTVLARDVAKRLVQHGWRAEPLVLETSYAGGLPRLAGAIETRRPRAVLMLGLAARARQVRVELYARGRASRLHPDVSGATPGAAGHAPTSGLAFRTTAQPLAALATLRRHALASRLSPSAGRYLCDASYALALSRTAPQGTPVLFVHVPWLAPKAGEKPAHRVAGFRPRRQELAASLAEIGVALARQGRTVSARDQRHAP